MSKTSKFAAAFGFAPAVAGEDPEKKDDKDAKAKKADKPERKDGESDEDYAKRCDEADKEKEAAAKKAAESEGEKEKEAKAAGHAAGVTAERARWAAVLSSPQASGRGVTACTLLETTDMSADALCATLATVPEMKAATIGLAARMAAAEIPKPSPGGAEEAAPGSAKANANAIVAAAAKARGETVRA